MGTRQNYFHIHIKLIKGKKVSSSVRRGSALGSIGANHVGRGSNPTNRLLER
jgi:hypothetical protein